MRGGWLILEARRRAGLSQAALAERVGTTQSAIARWEAGTTEPAFATVARVVRACGLDLHVRLAPADDGDTSLMTTLLSLTPAERIAHHQKLLDTERRLATARPIDG